MPESQPDIANDARKQLLSLMRALGIQDDRPIRNEIVDKISEGEARLEFFDILNLWKYLLVIASLQLVNPLVGLLLFL